MDLRQMRYLITAAEELNFTRAAERCHVSQPPLSRAIAQLEAELGCALFVRDSHKVILTKAGESLVEDARRALELIDNGVQRAKDISKGLHGTLVIGFGGTPVYLQWPILLRKFREDIPGVQIKFVSMPLLDQIDALRDSAIDIGIVRLPVHDELISTIPIHREPLIIATSANGIDGWQDIPIKINDLSESRFIAYAPRRGFDYHSDLRALCRLAGFEPNIAHEGQTTEAVIGMVACGEGIAIVPSDAQKLSMKGVLFRPLNVEDIPERLSLVEFALAWHRDNPSPAIRTFIRHVTTKTGHPLDKP